MHSIGHLFCSKSTNNWCDFTLNCRMHELEKYKIFHKIISTDAITNSKINVHMQFVCVALFSIVYYILQLILIAPQRSNPLDYTKLSNCFCVQNPNFSDRLRAICQLIAANHCDNKISDFDLCKLRPSVDSNMVLLIYHRLWLST